MYQKGIELVLYRNSLNEVNISELLSLHEYANEIVGQPIEIEVSAEIAKSLLDLKLGMSKIDIGKLNSEWSKRGFRRDMASSAASAIGRSWTIVSTWRWASRILARPSPIAGSSADDSLSPASCTK